MSDSIVIMVEEGGGDTLALHEGEPTLLRLYSWRRPDDGDAGLLGAVFRRKDIIISWGGSFGRNELVLEFSNTEKIKFFFFLMKR